MALPFVYREEAPARQAIAAMQVEAAAAENASRERIERERTASQRYATQAQLNDRDKDRAVAREDNALRRDIIFANKNLDADKTRDAAAKDRARLQFATIVEKLNNSLADPPTKSELEALLAGGPDLTEDQKNAARSLRDDAVKQAKSNAAMGQRAANNYKAELKGKGPTDPALPEIYTRLSRDPNVLFDRATGSVESAFRAPREDRMAPGAGVLRLPGAAAPAAGAIPTIADMQARVTGAPVGISPAQDYGGAMPPTRSQIGDAAPLGWGPPVTSSDIPKTPRSADIAVPPAAAVSIPAFSIPSSPMGAVDRWMRMLTPSEPAGSLPPRYGPEEQIVGPMDNPMRGLQPAIRVQPRAPSQIDQLLRMLPQMPEFARLPGNEQQIILDQITGGAATMPGFPRAYELNTLRPEYAPVDDRY